MTDLLTTKQAAKRMGHAPITLQHWRADPNSGLPFVKLGRSVRYRPEDIEAFVNARLVASADKAAA